MYYMPTPPGRPDAGEPAARPVQPADRYYSPAQPRLHRGLRTVTPRPRAAVSPPGAADAPAAGRLVGWLVAVAQTARPRQWPKNLLVFAAPLAGASLGRETASPTRWSPRPRSPPRRSPYTWSTTCWTPSGTAGIRSNGARRSPPVGCPRRTRSRVAGVSVAAGRRGCLDRRAALAALVGVYVASSLLYSAGAQAHSGGRAGLRGVRLRAPRARRRGADARAAVRLVPAGLQPGRAAGGHRQALHRDGRARPGRHPAPPVMRWYRARAAAGPASHRVRHDHHLPAVGGRRAWWLDQGLAPGERGAAGGDAGPFRPADRAGAPPGPSRTSSPGTCRWSAGTIWLLMFVAGL